MTRRPLLSALAAGVALGAVTAAIATGDDHPPAPAASPTPTPAPVTAGPPRRPADRLPDGRYSGEYAHFLVRKSTLRIEARADDPAGGPGWAARTFAGERRSIRGDQRTLSHPLYRQRMRCVEVVRTLDGQAGWVFAGRRFQSTTPGAPSQLQDCTSRARPQPVAKLATVVVFPDPATPVAERSAVYGLAPPGTRAVRLDQRELEIGAGGGFLALLDGNARAEDMAVTFTLRDGTAKRVPLGPQDGFPSLPPGVKGPDTLTPIQGSERAEARAPDPAGGPGWAVPVAETKEGPLCVGHAGQVLGDRIGWIDTTLGLFTPRRILRFDCVAFEPPPAKPCLTSWGGGGPDDPLQEGTLERHARIERRIPVGRFELTARCSDEVDRVTIQTPRDVRTLVPSARGHVVFALYEGNFPSGELVLTFHLRDGSSRTERVDLSL